MLSTKMCADTTAEEKNMFFADDLGECMLAAMLCDHCTFKPTCLINGLKDAPELGNSVWGGVVFKDGKPLVGEALFDDIQKWQDA